ncbi:MAG TPA: hypothetical protein VFH31_16745 [Pyrinomonadaceae bacterium]|nr:hypothetical protein [Pyrinomonadaceae bacterium]
MPALVLLIVNCIIFESSPAHENSFSDFGDLGNLLLGGFALAVAVAIAFTFVRLRMREKKPPPAQFISISDFERKE